MAADGTGLSHLLGRGSLMGTGLDSHGWAILISIGCAAGLLSGLLGLAAGFITVPLLTLALPALGIGTADALKIAAASSLFLVIPASIAHLQGKEAARGIDWELWGLLAPCVIAGALFATTFAGDITPRAYAVLFLLVMTAGAYRLLFGKKPHVVQTSPAYSTLIAKSVTGGGLAALVGLDASFFSTPLLRRYLPQREAVATAAALSLPLALAGIGGFLLSEAPASCGQNCIGLVHLPAVASIAMTQVLITPIGARLKDHLPLSSLRFLCGLAFGGLGLFVGVSALEPTLLFAETDALISELIIDPLCEPSPSPAQAPLAAGKL